MADAVIMKGRGGTALSEEVRLVRAILIKATSGARKEVAAAINKSGRALRDKLKSVAPVRAGANKRKSERKMIKERTAPGGVRGPGFLKKSIKLSKRATSRKLRGVVTMFYYGRFLDSGTKRGIGASHWASNVIKPHREAHVPMIKKAVDTALRNAQRG